MYNVDTLYFLLVFTKIFQVVNARKFDLLRFVSLRLFSGTDRESRIRQSRVHMNKTVYTFGNWDRREPHKTSLHSANGFERTFTGW